METTKDNSLLGTLGGVTIDFKFDTNDIIKIGLMLLIVSILFALVFSLIFKTLSK